MASSRGRIMQAKLAALLAGGALASSLVHAPAAAQGVPRAADASARTPGLQPTAPAAEAERVRLSATIRARAESWDWFGSGGDGAYGYGHILARLSAAQTKGAWQWRLEGAVPVLLGLPDDAVRPAPAGQLGLGATLYAANDATHSAASVFLKQAYVRWGRGARAVRVGRFEFSDGVERSAADPTLVAVKAQRVSQRLLGPFGFSAVGRAFDGVHAATGLPVGNLTVAVMRPTAGAFRVDGQPGLDVDVAYAALTAGSRSAATEHDLRLFAMWYRDGRGTVPTDNRAAPARSADRTDIRVVTLGGHWAAVRKAGRARYDVMAWGAWQGGSWGQQDHAATAVALEGGVQHAALPWNPWLRAGLLRSSGDRTAGDGRHQSFFQALPTPRVYARFPFYNMMNSSEAFVTLQAKPHARVTMRAGAHDLQLTESADLWYLGGGAFDGRVFGFTGRPSGGATALARVMDLSVAWQPHARLAVEVYGASARGGAVTRNLYNGSRDARFVYLETTLSR